MATKRILFLLALICAMLSACASQTPTPTSTLPFSATPSATTALSNTPSPEPTETATFTATPSPTATATPTFTPTETATATPIPTYIKLRGQVNVDQAVCHYGPGAPYLYKYGVYRGSNLEIIRRVELGNYVEIQAIGGNNPCWVKIDYLDIKGNLENVQPVSAEDVKIPLSPYYGPLTGVSARRDGNVVTVFWSPLILRAGDSSEQMPYVVEAWVCQGGKFVFLPLGSRTAALKITDEPGCSQRSHGRVTAAEKHGYTRRVEIPWPPIEETQAQPSLTPTP